MRSLEGNIVREKKNSNNGSHYLSLHPGTSQDLGANANNLHQNLFSTSSCRSESVEDSSQLCPDSWGAHLLVNAESTDGANVEGEENIGGREQLTEEDRQLAAALVAVQFVPQNGRHSLMHDFGHIAKVVSESRVVESSSNILDNSMRIYQEHAELRDTADLVPTLLPPLPPLKRVQDTVWYQVKHSLQFQQSKNISNTLNQLPNEECELDVNAQPSVGQNKQQQNRKSLPHKKRISRKLKKNIPHSNSLANSQQVGDDIQQAVEIMHENVSGQVISVQDDSLSNNQIVENTSHTEHAVFICQLCGDYYGEDQLQFFHHLKQHYEPNTQTMQIMQSTISNNGQINMDKIDDNIVVEGNQLPESLVELSLEGSVNEKQPLYSTGHHKLPNYMSVDKAIFGTNDKDSIFQTDDKVIYEQSQKQHNYTSVEKLYSCHHCNRSFKRQRQFEMHLREVHSKIDEISEFSEPEDLMEGIHVVVGAENEEYLEDDLSNENSNTVLIQTSISGGHDQYILPHLTIDNGHAHQAHLNTKQWHIKEILDIETEKVENPSIGDELSGDGGEEVSDLVEKTTNRIVCSFCGIIVQNQKEYSIHSAHCHIQLKEEVLQRMMNGEIDMDDADVVDEEIVEDNDLVVDENQIMNDQRDEVVDSKKIEDNEKFKDENHCQESPDDGINKEGPKAAVYKCKDCSREFKYRNSLIYHQQSHEGTRPFLCDVCNKRFFSASALKVHTRLHSGVKPYKCEECGRTFRQWGDLKYHCISIHSNTKQHQCEYCGKDFARKYSLIVHRRIHTGEKNYKCEFCDKKFRASSYLQTHRRIHTGEKPHVCDICSKAFRMKGDMRRHKNIHKKLKEKLANIKNETADDSKETVVLSSKKGKQKGFNCSIITPKKELKQEDKDVEVRESNSSNDGHANNSSPHNRAADELSEENKNASNSSYQMEAPIYSWPVYINLT